MLKELHGWRQSQGEISTMSDCTLIVPTYRRPTEMLRLLRVVAMLDDAPAEFIIIDGSPDESVQVAIKEWAFGRELPFDLIYVKSPPGLTRQRNVGLDVCSREFVYFLDDDCLPEPGYFESIRQVFVADKERQIGAVRGFLINGVGQSVKPLWRLRFALRIVPRGEPGHYHPCGTSGTWDAILPFTGTREVHVLAGGASAYRREVFEKHRFSEFFYGYAQGEDFEMALRIGKDWKLVVCGDARVDHRHAESGRPAGIPRGRMAARNRFFIWRRHSPSPGALNCIRFVADHFLSAFYHLACFVFRPWRPYYLGFAVGTIMGMCEWFISPPKHSEGIACTEYAFNLQELNPLVRTDVA